MRKKNDFIREYKKIHDKLESLENELEYYISNKELIEKDPDILQRLRRDIEENVSLLNNTRNNERRIFKY